MTPEAVKVFVDAGYPVVLTWGEGGSAQVLLVEIDGVWAVSKGGHRYHVPSITSIGRADSLNAIKYGRAL